MKRTAMLLLVALAAGLSSGCANRALTSANAGGVQLDLRPSDYQVNANVQGKDCTIRILGMTFNNPDLLVAEMDALAKAPGSNLLLNKHVYEQRETIVPVIVGNACFFVEGIAVTLR